MTFHELRLAKRLSQQAIATQLGVSMMAVSGWELHKHCVSQLNYDKIVALFDSKPSDLVIRNVGKPLAS